MTKTGVISEEPDITKQDCKDWIKPGKLTIALHDINAGQERIGQAWYNALEKKDQDKLTGTIYDPFYKDSWDDVILALRFLLDN